MGELSGKVAIITGGVSGMGLATVRLFVEQDARVIVADIQDEAGAALVREMGSSVHYRHTDVSRASDVEAVVGYAVETFGRLDVMFNNAGVVANAAAPVDFLDEVFTGADREIQVDLYGPLYGVKYAGRAMARQGGGSIISTASTAGFVPGHGIPLYRIAKAGVIAMTQNAAVALGGRGIRVNCISPGPIATPIIGASMGIPQAKADAIGKASFEMMLDLQPLKRLGQPEDVAHAALFLASERSAQITGVNLPVAGGQSLGADLVDRTAVLGQIIGGILAG
ncbi:SDR family NAD(P)-dependent oxidoreductase [Sinimarinibacterium flocculans]|uniref:SDR family NAD(P)-dependent oxidoreductase n=1 Tax=Sinimarinibacterium flocculans TaxID=985250 RepID=UPI0024933B9B|nr:SDR family oxidoreductase [Sinimarinibacterium flocculans]